MLWYGTLNSPNITIGLINRPRTSHYPFDKPTNVLNTISSINNLQVEGFNPNFSPQIFSTADALVVITV